MQQIYALLVPLIENLRQDKALKTYEAQLARLLGNVEAIMSGVVSYLHAQGMLSLREMQMALMIRDGLTNAEIAMQLHISLETVKAHRRNIRKKLGITGTKNKLGVYLHAFGDETAVPTHPYSSALRSANDSQNACNP
jgi:DNA-binding CsgD family transcriptional regulator